MNCDIVKNNENKHRVVTQNNMIKCKSHGVEIGCCWDWELCVIDDGSKRTLYIETQISLQGP